ncbi:tRNA (guanosine(37)-N1)-methyltransferase TrmD [Pelovirga terrestris]|uniref:tRNA (guanine-N(1)-)-methyltransferase n=1 Tax=Pelovirga terrestris TaxID=2771352 RepID=A0A8J6QUD8_9BACT|nr:tRNA (guanosine(37)-N1)-methyltransferase TrmD [Pelovirga terrestris]MBD1400160.1 tRNA (guanosine(37)-N1)-methyltransferase TrmD [Pelovirga terrestris]
MIFHVVTLFPEMLEAPLRESILGRAIKQGLIEVETHNLRHWAEGKHLSCDDAPYGGGDGMVLKPEPLCRAVTALKQRTPAARVLLMSPQGVPFDQHHAQRLATAEGLIFLCGRYAGFDERVRTTLVDEEFSIGDFVLTGGELPALVMIDAIARHLPGVLGSADSVTSDSFSDGLLEYPQYTRPPIFNGVAVPEVLLSGDHGRIDAWRREQQLLRTLQRRPDLLEKADLSGDDRRILEELRGVTDGS